MSQTDNTDPVDDLVQPAAENSGTASAASTPGDLEWTYSGKAMRAVCILYWCITIMLVAFGVYLTMFAGLNDYYLPIWGCSLGVAAVLWLVFYTVYFYRTLTIRYKMTDQRLYTYRGLFTRTSDSMELLFIEDILLIQTLWDRILNGGVGTIVIRSSADQSHPELKITGVDGPQEIFTRIDAVRTELRKKRAIMAT